MTPATTYYIIGHGLLSKGGPDQTAFFAPSAGRIVTICRLLDRKLSIRMEQPPLETHDASFPSQNIAPPDAPGEISQAPESAAPAFIGRDGLFALAVGGIDLLFWPVVRAIPSGSMVVVALTTLVSLFLILLFTVFMARAMRSSRAVGFNLALTLLLVLPSLIPILVHWLPTWPGWGAIVPYWKAYRSLFLTVSGLNTLALIWLAASLGTAVSRLVREFKLLLPMGVALALVDLYTVFGGGVVEAAVSGKNTVAQAAMTALTVQLPPMQSINGAAPFSLRIGFADFLFIALFFACFTRFGIPARRTFQVLFIMLFLYMAVVFLKDIALPALVPVAVVVIGMHWRRFRYERSEAFALLYAGMLLSTVLGYLVFRARHG